MTALKMGLQDTHSDVSSAALLALGETCAVLEVKHIFTELLALSTKMNCREKSRSIQYNFYQFLWS